MLPLLITPDTASNGFQTLVSWSVTLCCTDFHRQFSQTVDQGQRIVVLSLSPLMVSDEHLAIRPDSQLILLHWSQK